MDRYFATIILSLVFNLLTTGAWAQSKPLTVAFPTWAGNGVIFVAKEKGYFGALDVVPKVMDDTNAMTTAFRSGQLDIMTTTPDNMAILAAQGGDKGIDGKIFYMTDYSEGADGIIAMPNTNSVKELKGKTVGYTRAYVSQYLLAKALARAGLTMADIKGVEFDDPSLAAQAMLGGKVDAAVSWEPFLTQVVTEKKGNVLATSKEFGDLIPGELLASNKTLVERPDDLKIFIRGVMKAYADIKADPKAASIILAKGFNAKPEEMLNAMKGVHFADGALDARHLCGDHQRTAEIYDDAGDFWLGQKIIEKKGPAGKAEISPLGCDLFKTAK